MSALLQVRFSGRDINLAMDYLNTIKDVKREIIRIVKIDKKKYDLKLKLKILGHKVVSDNLSLMNLKNLRDLEYNNDKGERMLLHCELVRKQKDDKCIVM